MDLLVGQENGHIYLTHFQGLDPDVLLYTQAVPIQHNATLSYRLVVSTCLYCAIGAGMTL